jgi:hypothetical protein
MMSCLRERLWLRRGRLMVLGPMTGLSVMPEATTSFVTMRRASTSRRWLMVLTSSPP